MYLVIVIISNFYQITFFYLLKLLKKRPILYGIIFIVSFNYIVINIALPFIISFNNIYIYNAFYFFLLVILPYPFMVLFNITKILDNLFNYFKKH